MYVTDHTKFVCMPFPTGMVEDVGVVMTLDCMVTALARAAVARGIDPTTAMWVCGI